MLRKPADTASRTHWAGEQVQDTCAAAQFVLKAVPRGCTHPTCPKSAAVLSSLACRNEPSSQGPPQCSRITHADSRMFGGFMVVSSLVNWLGRLSEEGCSLPARMGWLSSEAFCPIWPKAMTYTAQEVGSSLALVLGSTGSTAGTQSTAGTPLLVSSQH